MSFPLIVLLIIFILFIIFFVYGEPLINKYKIKNNILLNTENITKEKFENLFKGKRETILEIKLNLLSEFDFEKAKSRNNSFKLFLENAI